MKLRKYTAIRICFVFVFGFSLSRGICLSEDVIDRVSLTEINLHLYKSHNLREIESFVERCTKLSLYQQISCSEYMLRSFVTTNECVIPGYSKNSTKHDITRACGRTAYAVENILGNGIDLPTSSQSDDLLITYRSQISASIELAKKRPQRGLEDFDAVKEEFRNKIVPGLHKNAMLSSAWMEHLLRKWFPLGRRAEDLQRIIEHAPSIRNGGELIYRFDDGIMAERYIFVITNDIIQAVLFDIEE